MLRTLPRTDTLVSMHNVLSARFPSLMVGCFVAVYSAAQATFGIVLGPTQSTAVFGEGIDVRTETKWGFSAGCQAGLPLSRHVVLQPELAYRQKGFDEVPPKAGFGDYRYRWTYDYLDLALLVRYYVGDAPEGVYLAAGPSLGVLLGGRVRDMKARSFDPAVNALVQSGPIAAFDPDWLGYGLVDPGACAAFGIQLPMGSTSLGVELRYQVGFGNVHNGFTVVDLNGATVGKLNSTNRCAMLALSWLLQVRPAAVAND